MNSNQRNSLDYSNAQLDQISDNTVIDVLPDKTDCESSTKYVLIKHDYYSTDSDFGRQLLKTFLLKLCNSYYNSIVVYLVDKGTKLLDKNNPLYDYYLSFSRKTKSTIVDMGSIDEYGVNAELESDIIYQTLDSIAEDVIYLVDLLVLE